MAVKDYRGSAGVITKRDSRTGTNVGQQDSRTGTTEGFDPCRSVVLVLDPI